MASAYRQTANVYGLIYDIDATIDPTDVTSLLRECFSVQIYMGLTARETLFISDESGLFS